MRKKNNYGVSKNVIHRIEQVMLVIFFTLSVYYGLKSIQLQVQLADYTLAIENLKWYQISRGIIGVETTDPQEISDKCIEHLDELNKELSETVSDKERIQKELNIAISHLLDRDSEEYENTNYEKTRAPKIDVVVTATN